METHMGISLKPSALIELTGLIGDEDIIIKEARFEMFDYNGKRAPSPAARFCLDRGDGEEVQQYFSLGKATDWLPSDDGKTLTPVGKATGLANSSNWAIFVTALVNAGFPENKIEDDITCFEGLEGHVDRIPAPERKGLVNKKEDATVLVMTKIHKLPWEKKGKKGSGSSSSKSSSNGKNSPSSSSDTGSAVTGKASSFILGVLAKYPDGIEKSLLPTEAFSMLKDDPDRNAIVKLIFEDEFLNSSENWKLEGGKVLPTE